MVVAVQDRERNQEVWLVVDENDAWNYNTQFASRLPRPFTYLRWAVSLEVVCGVLCVSAAVAQGRTLILAPIDKHGMTSINTGAHLSWIELVVSGQHRRRVPETLP